MGGYTAEIRETDVHAGNILPVAAWRLALLRTRRMAGSEPTEDY